MELVKTYVPTCKYLEINEPFLAKLCGSYVYNLELVCMYVHILYPMRDGTYLCTSKRDDTHCECGPTLFAKKTKLMKIVARSGCQIIPKNRYLIMVLSKIIWYLVQGQLNAN